MMKVKKLKEIVGTARQLVEEYPDWTCEHVYEFWNIMDQSMLDSCDEFHSVCNMYFKYKNDGLDADTAEVHTMAEIVKRGGKL